MRDARTVQQELVPDSEAREDLMDWLSQFHSVHWASTRCTAHYSLPPTASLSCNGFYFCLTPSVPLFCCFSCCFAFSVSPFPFPVIQFLSIVTLFLNFLLHVFSIILLFLFCYSNCFSFLLLQLSPFSVIATVYLCH